MDRTSTLSTQDRKILHELQQDGRLSNAELAERVGLSPTACWNHTRQLESEGYIQGYVALIDQKKLGLVELAKLPEVLEAHLVTGEYDYLIKVAVEGTAGYERFLREKLYRIARISHSRSMFVLRCVKSVPSVQV